MVTNPLTNPIPGINISSRTVGLGGALTNPTVLALRNKSIDRSYPVKDKTGRIWPDVESAYKFYKTGELHKDMARMTKIIRAKLTQHPALSVQIAERGGVDWLATCSHFVGVDDSRWEGSGTNSAFIRCLIDAYEQSKPKIPDDYPADPTKSHRNYVPVKMKGQNYDVRCDRASPWGNPFRLYSENERSKVIGEYRQWLWNEINQANGIERLIIPLVKARNIKGSPLRLGCWCAPKACHCDVLANACEWWESNLPVEHQEAKTPISESVQLSLLSGDLD